MSAQDLYEYIDSLYQDIDFMYKGKCGSICPFSRNDISLCYDGKEITVDSVDKAMQTPFISGFSLSEICEELDI